MPSSRCVSLSVEFELIGKNKASKYATAINLFVTISLKVSSISIMLWSDQRINNIG